MAEKSGIEWTDSTVNFWWGCTAVGPGCDHCYAEAWSKRTGEHLWGAGTPRRKIKSAVGLMQKLHDDRADWLAYAESVIGNRRALGMPARNIQRRRRVFVQSMSDLFDLEVQVEWFDEAWKTITACDGLNVQIVTKRVSAVEKRLAQINAKWPQHAGLLITACNQVEADRDVPRLLALKSKLSIPWVGLSIEPMLGAIDLWRWCGLDWVICGGESGARARPMHPEWARSLRDQCASIGISFFFKQWGEWIGAGHRTTDGIWPSDEEFEYADGCYRVGKKRAGRRLDGFEHNGMPA